MSYGGLASSSYGTGYRQFLTTLYPNPSVRDDQFRWGDSLIRWLRYRYLWSFYDQSIYWGFYGELVKREFGLYKNIRPILNSITRLVDFNVDHVMGGRLDREAGDGGKRPSALPIILGEKAHKSIRPCTARLWSCSRWQTKKSIFARYGAAMGDVGLELIPDPETRQVRMRVVHPAEIRACTFDPYNNVTSIQLERIERDPDDQAGNRYAEYMEQARLEDKVVVYRTYRNRTPYAWPGSPGEEWTTPLPFIPIFLNQHIDYGYNWGISATGPLISKSMDQDDQGSNLADATRRMVNGPWLLSGATLKPSPRGPSPWGGSDFGPKEPTTSNYYQVRSAQIATRADMPIIETPGPNVKMTPIMFPVPVGEVVGFLQMIEKNIRADYPELEIDNQDKAPASGRALREQGRRAVSKIEGVRAGYEDTLTKAQMAACVIGGVMGYPGYEAFNIDSMEDGKVDHHIGERAVFTPDPLDVIEVEQAEANAAKTWVEVGVPLRAVLAMRLDWEDEDLDTMDAMREAELEQKIKEFENKVARKEIEDAKQEATGAGLEPGAAPNPPPGGPPATNGTTATPPIGGKS